jgi:hypothetical protein
MANEKIDFRQGSIAYLSCYGLSMAKLAPITILTEPTRSILRLAELIERGDCSA